MRYLTSALLVLLASSSFAQREPNLVDLVRAGDREGAIEMIRLGADVNAALPDGSTALHWAVHNVDEEMTELLLSREADPARKNNYGAAPLAEAVRIANANLVGMLLAAGADPEATNADGQTALMLAASTGVVEVAKLLLDAGANVNAVEEWRGQTALMWAAANGHGPMAKLLIDHGADVNLRAASTDWGSQITAEPRAQYRPVGGLTPLLYAARSGCELCITAMLDAGADIDFPTPEAITPLMIAIDNYRYGAAKLLLERGANPHVWDWYGRTALYIATDMNSYGPDEARGGEMLDGPTALDIMRMLLELGVNRDPQLNHHRPGRGGNSGRFVDDLLTTGATPLLRAANSHDLAAVKLLLEYGAQVDLPNVNGVTPLLAAAGFGNARGVLRGTYDPSEEAKVIPVLEVLLAAGADIDAKVADTTSHNAVIARMSTMTDREGHNVVFAAAMQNWNSVVKYLVEEKGADITALDAHGKSVLDAVKGQAGGRADRPVSPETIALVESLLAAAQQRAN